jgi:hypothetical protein
VAWDAGFDCVCVGEVLTCRNKLGQREPGEEGHQVLCVLVSLRS